jgi:hypothetical protein
MPPSRLSGGNTSLSLSEIWGELDTEQKQKKLLDAYAEERKR